MNKLLQDSSAMYNCLQCLIKDGDSVLISDVEPSSGKIKLDRKKGMFWYADVWMFTDDEVRISWKKFNPIQRLRAEAGELPFNPVSDRIILRAIDMGAFTKTKLQLLSNTKESQSVFSVYKEMPLQGIVVAVGPGFFTESGNIRPLGVEVGDHVVLEMGAHLADFVFDGVLYYHTRASTILGKFGVEVAENYRKFELSFVNPNIKS